MQERKLPKKGDSSAANMMEVIPQKLIVHILSKLPLASLLRSKSVCRTWRSLIKDPLLISKHLSHRAEVDNDPSFIVQSNWPIPDQLFFVNFSDYSEEEKVISNKLPSSAMLMLLADSCNGLLCMHDTWQTIYICNPFTMLYIELPKLIKDRAKLGDLSFGFDPTAKEYKVVHIEFRRQRKTGGPVLNVDASILVKSEVQILTIGSPCWRNLGMIPYCFIWSTSKAMVNGRLHWLSRPNKFTTASLIISFDLENEQFNEVPKPDCCGLDSCFHNLMVLKGRLSAAAYHDYENLEIWVMKEYGVMESWIKQFNIANNYLPKTLQQDQDIWSFNYSRLHFPNSFVRVLCVFRSGKILLEYNGKALTFFDPRSGSFEDYTFPEIPNRFKIIVHVGSLNWLDT